MQPRGIRGTCSAVVVRLRWEGSIELDSMAMLAAEGCRFRSARMAGRLLPGRYFEELFGY